MKTILFLVFLASLALAQRIPVSFLNDSHSLQGRGLVLATDCIATPGASKNQPADAVPPLSPGGVVGTQGTVAPGRPAVYDPQYGCVQNGYWDQSSYPSKPFGWVYEAARMNITQPAWSILWAGRRMGAPATYLLGYDENVFSLISDTTAGKIQFWASSKYTGSDPNTPSQIDRAALGRYGIYQWSLAGPGSWMKSKDGAAWTVNRTVFALNAATPVSRFSLAPAITGTQKPWVAIGAVGFWNGGLTERDNMANARAVKRRLDATGASRTDYDGLIAYIGASSTVTDSLIGDYTGRWTSVVTAHLRTHRWLDWHIAAANSSGAQGILANIAYINALYGIWGTGAGKTYIATLEACSNDIVVYGRTAAQCEADITAIINSLKATGWKVVVTDILPRGDVTDAAELERLAYNAWFATDCVNDANQVCLRLTLHTEFGNGKTTANDLNCYLPDKIHQTAYCQAIWAADDITAIESIW